MGGGGGDTRSTSVAEPPAETKPYLTPYMERANTLSQNPYQAYGGQTVAGLTPDQSSAFGMIRNRATQGSPVTGLANLNAANTLSGAYLNPNTNPFLAQNVGTAMGQAAGALNSQFNRPGAFGSTAHQGVMARELGNIASNMYGQNYNMERGNMMNAMGMSPQLAQADYADASMLMGAGDAQRALEQEQLNALYGAWQQAQQYPYQQLDVLGNAIMTTMGAGGTTKMYGSGANPAGQWVGAGLTAAGLLG